MNHEREATETSQGRRYYNPVQKDYTTFLETSEQTGAGSRSSRSRSPPAAGMVPTTTRPTTSTSRSSKAPWRCFLARTRTRCIRGRRRPPRNTLHCFKNPTGESTTFLVELRPGSSGFEKAMKAAYGLAFNGRSWPGVPARKASTRNWKRSTVSNSRPALQKE
jgi:hypothetical protein